VTGRLTRRTLLAGVRFLAGRDTDLNRIVSTLGPPPLWQRPPGFSTLVRIILEQQVSLASAKAAFDRLAMAIDPVTPAAFLTLSDDVLRGMGFSRQKTAYGRALATAIIDGTLDLDAVECMPDAAARAALIQVKGIGSWTADIYLLMALGRPDVWPGGDLALAVALQRLKGWPRRPGPEKTAVAAESWRPWRAVAARLLWHYYLQAGDAS
jgi:DNA-3-methyladenine glycosylase II